MNLSFKLVRELSETQAREVLERIRWPDGPVCPHCDNKGAYKLVSKEGAKRPMRPGVYKCKECRKQFTVTVGTVFDGSHIAIRDWLMAACLICSSKKGMSANQLHRTLGITLKTAWFMAHRIRLAMTQEPMEVLMSGTVEADETFVGGLEGNKHKSKRKNVRGGYKGKVPVFALVERGGEVRAQTITNVSQKTLKEVINKHVNRDAKIYTDDYTGYRRLHWEYRRHDVVSHLEGEYVRDDVHTNTIEGWFALLKRGVIGTFHHVSEQHLDRYLDEFAFRYNLRFVSDGERVSYALAKIVGKKLKYKEVIKR